MRTIIYLLIMIALCSCQSKHEADQPDPLSELISSNLTKNGMIDPELLIGEWACIAFAYTTDGNEISNETALSGGKLTIPVASTPKNYSENREDLWRLHYYNSYWWSCSLSGNSIKLTLLLYTKINVVPEERDITVALKNAYSFVIKGDELIIYFTGVEDKNLLILKKNDNP